MIKKLQNIYPDSETFWYPLRTLVTVRKAVRLAAYVAMIRIIQIQKNATKVRTAMWFFGRSPPVQTQWAGLVNTVGGA